MDLCRGSPVRILNGWALVVVNCGVNCGSRNAGQSDICECLRHVLNSLVKHPAAARPISGTTKPPGPTVPPAGNPAFRHHQFLDQPPAACRQTGRSFARTGGGSHQFAGLGKVRHDYRPGSGRCAEYHRRARSGCSAEFPVRAGLEHIDDGVKSPTPNLQRIACRLAAQSLNGRAI